MTTAFALQNDILGPGPAQMIIIPAQMNPVLIKFIGSGIFLCLIILLTGINYEQLIPQKFYNKIYDYTLTSYLLASLKRQTT